MSRPLRRIVLMVLLMAVAVPNAPAAAQRRNSLNALGTRLVNRYLSDLERHDVGDLHRFLSPAFQVQRTDGRQTKPQVIHNPPTIAGYTIRGMRATSAANTLVVTFQLATKEVINGKPLSTGYSPRLATFIAIAKGWQMTGYANFNTPAAPTAGLG